MPKRRINTDKGQHALACVMSYICDGLPHEAPRQEMMTAVRYTLEELAQRYPGQSVEVRVPPAGAVQILTGTHHRRGTPPAVVETDMVTWISLATGIVTWHEALEKACVHASGERTDLSALLPLDTLGDATPKELQE